jgi:hypothetical protein
MIDRAIDELAKLIIRLDNNPKKTRKEQNTIKKIQEIRETIQNAVLYAKLKKSRVKVCFVYFIYNFSPPILFLYRIFDFMESTERDLIISFSVLEYLL